MLSARMVVEKFNDKNISIEEKRKYKTIINDALAIFTTTYADSSPPESLIDEVLELAKANDEELYRSSVSSLTVVLSHNNFLNHIKSLQGLTCILRNPAMDYRLGDDEIRNLLTLVLSRVKTDATTLDALNKLLDAMVATPYKIGDYVEKRAIVKQLEKIQKEAKESHDYAAVFQAGLALKTLEGIGVNESKQADWKRRAMAFATGIEALMKIASSITEAAATFGAATIFIVPDVIHNARDAMKSFQQAFDGVVSHVNEWYGHIKDLQDLLAAAAFEKNDNTKDALSAEDLKPLFERLKSYVTREKDKLPRDIQYVIIDSLEKILLLRTDEKVIGLGCDLLKIYYEANNTHLDKHPKETAAVRARVIEALLMAKRLSPENKKKALIHCLVGLKGSNSLDRETYAADKKIAQTNLANKKASHASNIPLLETLVAKAQHRLEKLLTDHKGKRNIVIPLIGEGAVVNAPVDVNQQYIGMKFTGNVQDIITLMENEVTRRVLEVDAEAARSVISKQVVGSMAIIRARLNINQVSQAPEVDLTSGSSAAVKTQSPQISFKLSEALTNLIKDSFTKEKNYHLQCRRVNANELTITYISSQEKPFQVPVQLHKFKEACEKIVQDAKQTCTMEQSGDNGEIIKITAEKQVINALADLLIRQGLSIGPSIVRRHHYFFHGEHTQNTQIQGSQAPTSTAATSATDMDVTDSVATAEEAVFNCRMQ